MRELKYFIIFSLFFSGCASMANSVPGFEPKEFKELAKYHGKTVRLTKAMDLQLRYTDESGNEAGWLVNDDGTISDEPDQAGFSKRYVGPLNIQKYKEKYGLFDLSFRPDYAPYSKCKCTYSAKKNWVLPIGTELKIKYVDQEWGLDAGLSHTMYGTVKLPNAEESVEFYFYISTKKIPFEIKEVG